MKLRLGFVSNSSSSSFSIPLEAVTGEHIKLIEAHQIKGRKMGISYADTDPWTIEVTDDVIRGWTTMDNFDMRQFLSKIGILDHLITWNDGHFWDSPFE